MFELTRPTSLLLYLLRELLPKPELYTDYQTAMNIATCRHVKTSREYYVNYFMYILCE